MAKRSKNFDAPLNIYEAQAGSWRCKEDGTPYTYSELAKQLPAYLKENTMRVVLTAVLIFLLRTAPERSLPCLKMVRHLPMERRW